MSNSTTLPLLKGRISLEAALDHDRDIIHELSYHPKKVDLACYIIEHRSQIIEIIARHLRVSSSYLDVDEICQAKNWIFGSFNVCIPFHIKDAQSLGLPRQILLRIPQPYKVDDASSSSNVDEKLRCEAATYIWLQQNCPEIPIPRLFGFGFPGTLSFTQLENETLWNSLVWNIRYASAWLSGNILPRYFAHHRNSVPEIGYLLLEYIEDGAMLSDTWDKHCHDSNRLTNLFRDMSRIMISLAKLPLPRIGSWTMNDKGILSLSNRPLTFQLHQLENAGIPIEMPRDLTYTSVEPYYLDLLACQDVRIRHQPNAVHDKEDGFIQLAALTGLRALLPVFLDRQTRRGPFVFSLTDLHQSNIFVDENWRITRIIDLEWSCVLPLQMLGPPFWITSRGADQLYGANQDEFKVLYDKFVHIFEEEERACQCSHLYSQMLWSSWDTGRYWFSRALDCPDASCGLFMRNIDPRLGARRPRSDEVLTRYWTEGALEFISTKVAQNARYNDRIRDLFATPDSAERIKQ